MSASGKRLLAACIFALCSIPVLIVYTWVFTPDLIPHEASGTVKSWMQHGTSIRHPERFR